MFANVRTQMGHDSGEYVAFCDCFDLVGQGETEAATRENAGDLVRSFLDAFLERNRLDEALAPPAWCKEKITRDTFFERLLDLLRLKDAGEVVAVRLAKGSCA